MKERFKITGGATATVRYIQVAQLQQLVLSRIWSHLDSTTFSNNAVDINAEGILGVPSRLQLNSPRIFRSLLGMSIHGIGRSKMLFIPELSL